MSPEDRLGSIFCRDRYRAREVQYVCEHTIGTVEDAENQLWMMMGDFNSRSRVDNDQYKYADDDPRLLVHDYIKANTPYIDVIKAKYPNEFKPTTGGKNSRIDYVYCTPALYDRVTFADVIWDEYTTPVRTDLSTRPSRRSSSRDAGRRDPSTTSRSPASFRMSRHGCSVPACTGAAYPARRRPARSSWP